MDGGSNDGSVEIIKKYEPWLSQWRSGPDHGQYDAVQKGFQVSHGQIMAYLNSDDLYFPWTIKVVAELFTLFPQIQWLTTSNIAVASADSRFSFVGYIHNRSRRWFFSNRGEKLKSSGFIPQEATFWRRTLWEQAGSRFNIDMKYAGDFELWSRFFKYAAPVMVNMPLAIFRHHTEQKTKQFEKYLEEANRVLSCYQDPSQLPPILIDALNYVHQRLNYDGDWLGTRCDKINFYPLEGRWKYEKSLETQAG